MFKAIHRASQAYLLDGPLAEARHRAFGSGSSGWAEFEVGRRALATAQQLGDAGDGAHSAALLYRSAVILFLEAHEAREVHEALEGAPNTEALDRFTRLRRQPPIDEALASLTLAQVAGVERLLSSDSNEVHVARLPAGDLVSLLPALNQLAVALGDPLEVEATRVARLQFRRRVRVAVPLLIAMLLLGWTVMRVTRKPNLALHRPVVVETASSVHRVDPRALVDGNRTNLGVHTDDGKLHRVTIDLGSVQRIREVRVTNRMDCCQDRAIPLRLESSTDGVKYRLLAERKTHFYTWEPPFEPRDARHLRLVHRSSQPLHLAEVEVY